METIERTIELEGRTIPFDEVGQGPPLVFVHGVWATGGAWDAVVAALSPRFRCIVPTLPLGVHRIATPPEVDHSPQALARVIAGLIDALDLHDVTLIGNDTGGAICQLLIADRPERIGRLVLTNCDAFEVFPPRILAPLYLAARSRTLWNGFARLGRRPGAGRRFWSTVARSEPDMNLVRMLLKRFTDEPAIREDLRRTLITIRPRLTLDAAKHFARFTRPVLVIWGTDDMFFPVSLGRRLAAAFPNAQLELVPKAKLFVMIDAPDAVAGAISRFVAPRILEERHPA